jgi:predicted DNA-binding transcriptional regulator YafY
VENIDPKLDELLRAAITQRRLVQLRYDDRPRILEPHDYGVQSGVIRLLAYQVGGSSSGKLPNWRWLDVDRISDLQILSRTFRGGRSVPTGKHHEWDQLFIRVKPAKAEHS